MDRVRTRMWTLGAPDDVRLRQREAMFVWVRWAFVGVAVLGSALDDGRSAALAWSAPVVLAAVNVLAVVGPRRIRSTRGLTILGVVVNVGDFVVVTISLFTYSGNADTATPLLLVLVVIEAAMRWNVTGAAAGGAAAGAVVVAWMVEREATYGIDARFSTALARVGAYILTGALLGALIRQLEGAGREVQRQIRRTDAVGRFAL
ncbi:MAG TPA: hypothetical protein VM618_07165, partial [Acidimicrobiia bacterium]|nr:hypothetical protein [Acidimicrobiia bacterium]